MSWRAVLLAWAAALFTVLAAWLVITRSGVVPGLTPLFSAGEPGADSINKVEIDRGGGELFEFVRKDGGWAQSAPFECAVDALAIRSVIDSALGLVSSRSLGISALGDSGIKAEVYGLSAGCPSMSMTSNSGTVRLELGRRAPAGRAWVRVSGRGVAESVTARLHDVVLEDDPRQWRQMQLFPSVGMEADRIDVGAQDSKSGSLIEVALERTGSGWRLSKPVSARADSEAVQALIMALGRARAVGVIADSPDDLAAYGLSSPVARIAVSRTLRQARPDGTVESREVIESVQVGQQIVAGLPERYAMRVGIPSVLEIDGTTVASLLPDVIPLIDARACAVAPVDVAAIIVAPIGGAEHSFTLRRQGAQWLCELSVSGAPPSGSPPEVAEVPAAPAVAPAAPTVLNDRVDRLLTILCLTRAGEIALQSMPGDLVVGEIRLMGFDGRELARIVVGHEQKDAGKWALSEGDGVLRVFPASLGLSLDSGSFAGK